MVARGRGGGKTPEKVMHLLQAEVTKTSQAATARATGLTLQTVQRYIKGIGEPSQATLEKLADYFGVSIVELRGDNRYWYTDDALGKEIRLMYDETLAAILKKYPNSSGQEIVSKMREIQKSVLNLTDNE
jgi:transcriptional regulator with XRE-family HTH domain